MPDEFELKDENDEADIDLAATPLVDDEEDAAEDVDSPEVPLSKLKATGLTDEIDAEDLLDEEEEEDDMELLGAEDWEE